jgi:WD40 repeat protein
MGLGSEIQKERHLKPKRTTVLAFAIDKYENGWPELKYPVDDCRRLLKVLRERYGVLAEAGSGGYFYNERASKKALLQRLDSLRRKDENGEWRVHPDEDLIIIFSGHGYEDDAGFDRRGYFAPSGSKKPVEFTDCAELINDDDIVGILSQVRARHILLIIDACFSAAFSNKEIGLPQDILPNEGSKSENNPSRWILTSGRNEEVPDRSIFADTLITLLGENQDASVSITRLEAELKEKLHKKKLPTPHCDNLVRKEYEGGGFNLYLGDPFLNNKVVSDNSKDQAGLLLRLRQNSEKYRNKLLHKGRFKHVKIEKVLLAGTNLPSMRETRVKLVDSTSEELITSIISLWQDETPHGVLIGTGGMGKTLSLLHVWEKFLGEGKYPLPLFIALNEYNNAPEADKQDFIVSSIAKHYLNEESLTKATKNRLWELFKRDRKSGRPGFVLLLDGFNEITTAKDALTIELNKLASGAGNVQLMVTSRYVEIRNFTWARDAKQMELVPLDEDAIADYLRQAKIPIPSNERLVKLFGNPMMLTLYAGADRTARKYGLDTRFSFLTVQTEAELLWNFQEAQLAKLLEDHEGREEEQVYIIFLLRYLVPYIAWRMEKEGHFFITNDLGQNSKFNFNTVIGEACLKLRGRGSLAQFPDIRRIANKLSLRDLDDLDDLDRSESIREYLVGHLNIMVHEGSDLRFLHQNFRDFYAACHLLNCIKFALAEGKRPEEWKERTFPVYLRRMIGELEGEYLFDPYDFLDNKALPNRLVDNLLSKLLDRCREMDMVGNHAVRNMVTIFHESRGNLAGINLRSLDLRKINFNNIQFSAHKGKKYITTNLEKTKVNGKQFIFEGHSGLVNSITYSLDGKKILSSSEDKVIKEWSAETGECIQTLVGHKWSVLSAIYSPNGKRILSASGDKTIREWSVKSGRCLRTISGHKWEVKSATYSPDGEKILSISRDRTIKEWSVKSGKCIKTYTGDEGPFTSAVYSPDGLKILSVSGDKTIVEWSVKSRKSLRTILEHSGKVTSAVYSPDGLKILSAAEDRTIKEWSVKSGKCLQTILGHTGDVRSAIYSFDGLKILSAAKDKTIKEWSVESGLCLKTLIGHTGKVNKAIYNHNNQKVLSISDDNTVKEWALNTGECIRTLRGLNLGTVSAVYNTDGNKILSTSKDNTVKEWSVKTKKCLQTFIGHTRDCNSVIYSKDDHRLLSSSEDKTIKEWTVDTGKCMRTFIGHGDGVTSAIYCKTEQKILSASKDSTIKEWVTKTGKCLQTLSAHTSWVNSAIYSPNEKRILSVSVDATIKEWDTQSGNCLQTISKNGFPFQTVAYSIDGRKIRSTSWDGTEIIWCLGSGRSLTTTTKQKNHYPTTIISADVTKDLLEKIGSLDYWEKSLHAQIDDHDPGLFVQGLDLRNLHPDSVFTEEEKNRLRRYGAIFDDQDKADWETAVEDAYGKDDE